MSGQHPPRKKTTTEWEMMEREQGRRYWPHDLPQHPEQLPGERFLGNFDDVTRAIIGWRSARRGKVAYGADGEPLGKRWPGSFPVFAQECEIVGGL
jgi:hypothetical protein